MATETKVKEHPILFKGRLVRAILEGQKTQTRRPVKPQPKCELDGAYFDAYNGGPQWNWWLPDNRLCNGHDIIRCPYGVPVDRLWVRENFYVQPELWARDHGPQPRHFTADGDTQCLEDYVQKPSIHLPRWASRITLEVTGVRVERVQDITEEDAKAEGMEFDGRYWIGGIHPLKKTPQCWPTATQAFHASWNAIYEARRRGWLANPWVWVVEFKRLEE